ncbi:MAG: hypothetical protein PHS92_02180 [Candidatus Gracilibacteria bacterium]|nr:hypothetical protein [Candidatus Gracilibacteria bacterium]
MMELDIEVLKRLSKKSNNSKVQFRGDYQKLIDEVILLLEEKTIELVGKKFKINYTSVGKNNLKIKIEDDELKIEKLIDCVLRHTLAEEKYGYVIIDMIANEYSKKPKSVILGKYDLMKKDILVDAVIGKMFQIIDEIQ